MQGVAASHDRVVAFHEKPVAHVHVVEPVTVPIPPFSARVGHAVQTVAPFALKVLAGHAVQPIWAVRLQGNVS